jgi:hypothetical protein
MIVGMSSMPASYEMTSVRGVEPLRVEPAGQRGG